MYEKVVDYCIDVSYCLYNYIWNYIMHLDGMLHKGVGMIEQNQYFCKFIFINSLAVVDTLQTVKTELQT